MRKRVLLLPLALIAAVSLPTLALLKSATAADKETPALRRITCPTDYRTSLQAIRTGFFAQRKLVTTTYANAQALQVTDLAHLPYAHGSIFLFEYAEPVWAEDGTPRRDSEGALLKGKVVRLDVMERGPGFGEAYGDDRAGEWEFASFQPDGRELLQAWPDSPGVPPAAPAKCAACHTQAASRDFVFAGRFPLFTGDQ